MLDIAVVGIGCRFPGGATNPVEFWEFLLAKGDGIGEVPSDRWSLEKFYDPDPDAPGRMYVRNGGFLDQSPWDFDPDYFGISAREAAIMDPQQRLLLEVAVEALDDAGLAGRVAGGDVGVYVGGFTSDNQVGRHAPLSRAAINSHTATSGTFTMLSNRLSYVLDLQGPSMTIDTACSSSLVAIHEAAQAVARGECSVALAGGVNVMIAPETFISMCKGRFLAPDGRCKTFDARADGYARGEGSGVVVLKPLAQARADGDRVYAVIRATGANQDGRTSGITVPNPAAQARLAARVLSESGLSAEQIGYVEAHGTGTAIGDPLELQALGEVYGAVPGRDRKLLVGSVKAGIGHLEAAAGVAGVIKAALTLHHRQIAPQAWLEELNPAIPFEDYRVAVPTAVTDFPVRADGTDGAEVAAVAVNGFGYGGTNAHLIMVADDPADRADDHADDHVDGHVDDQVGSAPRLQVLPISGRSEAAVRVSAARWADQLESADVDPARLQRAAWGRRLHHPVRVALPWTDHADLLGQLRGLAGSEGRSPAKIISGDRPERGGRPVFVFSGMGPQWWGMARELSVAGGVFARTAAEIDEAFVPIAGWSILAALGADADSSRVSRTEVAQPANFLVQVALSAELAARGITPEAVLGHSVGEVSAAYVSGALGLEDALRVSCHRARLQARTAGTGGMLAVGLPEAEVADLLAGDEMLLGQVDVAAVNSPSSVTLAGPTAVLEVLAADLAADGIFTRALQVEVPYHSRLMDPVLGDIRATLADIEPSVPRIPLYSSVTAQQITGADWGAGYWVDNVRRTVRFAAAVEAMIADGHRVFCEVGPHPVLGGNVREILVRSGETGAVIGTLNRKQSDADSLNRLVADLYVVGALDVRGEPGRLGPTPHVDLPGYPWQRNRLWSEVSASAQDRLGDPEADPLLGQPSETAASQWQTELSVTSLPWLLDHVVDQLVLLPGAGFVDAALAAAAALGPRSTQALADVEFVAPRVIDRHDVPALRTSVEASTGRFAISSRGAEETSWTRNAGGRLVDADLRPQRHDFTRPENARSVSGVDLYPELRARGLDYGPAFRGIVDAWVGPRRLVAHVHTAAADRPSTHLAHPATTDAALQCVAALIAEDPDAPSGPVVPARMAAVRRHGPLPADVQVAVSRLDRPGLWADIALADDAGTVLLELLGVEFRPVRPAISPSVQLEPLWYELVWQQADSTPTPPGWPGTAVPALDSLVLVTPGAGDSAVSRGLLAHHADSRLVRLTESDTPLIAAIRDDVEQAAAAGGSVAVVYLAADAPPPGQAHLALPEPVDGPADPDVLTAAVRLTDGLIRTARAVQAVADERLLDGASAAVPISAVVITQDAFGVPSFEVDRAAEIRLDQAALIGARRTLRNEQPDVSWRLLDLTAEEPAVDLVLAELTGTEDPAVALDEVAFRAGRRMITTLQRNLSDHLGVLETARPLTDPDASYRVEAASNLLADLGLREVPRVAPAAGQVEVRVLSAGLNYKDSAKVIGLLTERELAGTYFGTALGMEAIGVVVRTGPGVTSYRVGDRLSIGMRDSLRRYLTIDIDAGGAVSLAPTPWSDTDSALNLPFLTAHHSLLDVARLRAGETVLIQGAAGGVGLAAIQVAKRTGATVIGTASSVERRAAVLAAGADRVLDSRSLNFVSEVRALTEGRGVDVVLNSAPGEVIAANLEAAAEFGRIVEIGKADIYGGGLLALAPFDKNLSFLAVDIDRMLAFRRPAVLELIAAVNAAFESGRYVPLPCTVYPASQVRDAFEAVARGRHIGRVVLDFGEQAPLVKPPRPELAIHPDARYLITGGFGTFGLATARWLAASGARHLVLVGRRGAVDEPAKQQLAAFAAAGIAVEEVALDIAERDETRALIDRLAADGAPLRGIFHAAGVLDDRAFTEIDVASLRRVLGPKVAGAVHLDEATRARGIELDHFVTFSSASAITGTVPQASYAAANTVLDSLVRRRRDQGLRALTVNWGSLSGGMAGSSVEVERYLAAIGLQEIDMDLAARLLGEALALDVVHVGILNIDWARWGASHPASATTSRFADHVGAAASAGSGTARLRADLLALPETQRIEVVAYMLAEQLAVVLGIPAEGIDLDTALPDLGMDSLMAVEMQVRVNLALEIEVSALEFGRGSLSALAGRLVPLLTGSVPGGGASSAAAATLGAVQ